MARQLCIVATQHAELYAYLRRRFAADEVILDRRRGERRRQDIPVPWERRVAGRRSRPEVDEHLLAHSHVIVTIETPDDVAGS